MTDRTFDLNRLEWTQIDGNFPYLGADLIPQEEPGMTVPQVAIEQDHLGSHTLTLWNLQELGENKTSATSTKDADFPILDKLFGGREAWKSFLAAKDHDARNERAARYDYKNFTSRSTPTLIYERELLEMPIREALAECWHKATVTLPEHYGRGERPWHIKIDMSGCAFPGSVPVFDCPDEINSGELHLTRADGEEMTVSTEGMDWDALEETVFDFMLDWNADVRNAQQLAVRAKKEMDDLQKQLHAAKAQRDRALRGLRKLGGLSVPDIAALTDTPLRSCQKALGQ